MPDTNNDVTVVDNHIYFYADVDTPNCKKLIEEIRKVDASLRSERIYRDIPKDYPLVPIWLHIQSGGGSSFSGLGMIDQLRRIETPIYSIIEGYTASAATFISMACNKRYMLTNSLFLIHQASGFSAGTYEKLQDDLRLMDKIMEKAVSFYVQGSNLSEDEVRELLKRDSWFSAEECLEMGFIDGIL